MKSPLLAVTAALLMLGANSAANAKGCIKGAIVGGVAGHVAGHGKIGALAGCVIGIMRPTSTRNSNKRTSAPTRSNDETASKALSERFPQKEVLAGELGFEPRQAESESAVLPLDDPPRPSHTGHARQNASACANRKARCLRGRYCRRWLYRFGWPTENPLSPLRD